MGFNSGFKGLNKILVKENKMAFPTESCRQILNMY